MVPFFLYLSLLLLTVRSNGNEFWTPELRQLRHYAATGPTPQHLSARGYYMNKSSLCLYEEALKIKRRSPPRKCRALAVSTINSIVASDSFEQSDHAPQCKYQLFSSVLLPIQSQYATKKEVQLEWKVYISERDCRYRESIGGSSLQVQIYLNDQARMVVHCVFQNFFDGNYVFLCTFKSQDILGRRQDGSGAGVVGSVCNSMCKTRVVAVLDYQGFAAFDEIYGLESGLNMVVVNKTLDFQLIQLPGVLGLHQRKSDAPLTCCRNFSISQAPWGPIKETGAALPVPVAWRSSMRSQAPKTPPLGANKHVSKGEGDGTVRIEMGTRSGAGAAAAAAGSVFEKYERVYFMGSSHTRYMWDAIAIRYFNGSDTIRKLPQHHADEVVGNVWYVNNLFSMTLPDMIKVVCDSTYAYAPPEDDQEGGREGEGEGGGGGSSSTGGNSTRGKGKKKMSAFVIEVGAWDLDFAPPASMVAFEPSAAAPVEVVRALALGANSQHLYSVSDVKAAHTTQEHSAFPEFTPYGERPERRDFSTGIPGISSTSFCSTQDIKVVWVTAAPTPECIAPRVATAAAAAAGGGWAGKKSRGSVSGSGSGSAVSGVSGVRSRRLPEQTNHNVHSGTRTGRGKDPSDGGSDGSDGASLVHRVGGRSDSRKTGALHRRNQQVLHRSSTKTLCANGEEVPVTYDSRGYRNNYAIAATNQYFVDAFNSPRLQYSSFSDRGMSLSHMSTSSLKETPASGARTRSSSMFSWASSWWATAWREMGNIAPDQAPSELDFAAKIVSRGSSTSTSSSSSTGSGAKQDGAAIPSTRKRAEAVTYSLRAFAEAAAQLKQEQMQLEQTLGYWSAVKVVDAFNLIYPYRNENVCGLHYICCRHTKVVGSQTEQQQQQQQQHDVKLDLLVSRGGELVINQVLDALQ
jgi:hypothetical protein